MDIVVHPARRTLSVAAGTNLLQALRDHGIPMSYSCMAGRCGTCRCRIAAGSATGPGRVAHHPADGAAGQVLACQTVLTGPCEIEITEPDEVVVHPARSLRATVAAIDAPTHDIRRIRLRPARPLDFSPGQYVQLQFTPAHIRPYSMAGLPADEMLEFHVRRVAGGHVTGYVADTLQVGDAVRVSGPLGSAYLRRMHTGPMLCVAGGTGLAPILSIVRGAIAEGMRNPIHLYFGVRSAHDLYGLDWLADLQRRHAALQVHPVLATGQAPGCRTGPVTEAIAQDWSRLDGFRAYLCGAPPMVEAAARLARQAGVEPDRIHADAFYASAP